MAWFSVPVESDPELRAILDELTKTTALLTTAISKTGDHLLSAIENLSTELAELASAEQMPSSVIAAAVAAFQSHQAAIADLTTQLEIANAALDDPAIREIVDQMDDLTNRITADAANLQTAISPNPPQT